MRTVILKKQYLYFQPGQELRFVDDKQADKLVNDGIAKIKKDEKSLDTATKDKMMRKGRHKAQA